MGHSQTQMEIYRVLARKAPLETEAKAELHRLITMMEADPRLGMQWGECHLYAFITHTLSAAQNIFLRHLKEFNGDLLSTAYASATKSPWARKVDDFKEELEWHQSKIAIVARAINRDSLNAPQLAFALTLLNTVNAPEPKDATERALLDCAVYQYEQGTDFWETNHVSVETVIDVSKSLLSYCGEETLTPDEVASRFCLAIKVDSRGLTVHPVERWGIHGIKEDEGESTQRAELWLPTNTLVTPDEIHEFEELLEATNVAELDWQRFLDRHPVFLYMLGDFDAHRREVVLSPQLLLDDAEDEFQLRPDFLLRRMGTDLWDFLEIKPPNVRMVGGRKSRRRFSSSVADALAQVRVYAEFLRQKNHQAWLRKKNGLKFSFPRSHLLVGRDSAFGSTLEKQELLAGETVRIFTYDDLHRIAKHRLLR